LDSLPQFFTRFLLSPHTLPLPPQYFSLSTANDVPGAKYGEGRDEREREKVGQRAPFCGS